MRKLDLEIKLAARKYNVDEQELRNEFMKRSAKGNWESLTDAMFDTLSSMDEKDEALDEMNAVAGKNPTKANLLKFCELAKEIGSKKLKNQIIKICEGITNGDFSDEFKYSYNPPGNSSATKELFSLFKQAFKYND